MPRHAGEENGKILYYATGHGLDGSAGQGAPGPVAPVVEAAS